MALLVSTITKFDNDTPWINWDNKSLWTREENESIIRPYLSFTTSLPGFQWTSFKISELYNVMTITRGFDTLFDAQKAVEELYTNPINPAVVAGRELMKKKHEELNIPWPTTSYAIIS